MPEAEEAFEYMPTLWRGDDAPFAHGRISLTAD